MANISKAIRDDLNQARMAKNKITETTLVSASGVTTIWGVIKPLYDVPDDALLEIFGEVRVATAEETEAYNKINSP